MSTILEQEHVWSHWLIHDREAHPFPENGVRQWRVIQRWIQEVKPPVIGSTEKGMPIHETRKIIDVGCGDGQFVKRLLPYGSVTGTDLSAEMMERNRAKYPTARFVAGDFMQLEFSLGTFDVVVSCEFLTHIADQPACLAKMASLLRPGGVLMLATQNKWAMDRFVKSPNPGWIRQYLTPKQLRAMLAPHFRIQDLTTIGPFDSHLREARYINSTKLSKIPGADRIKGALGFGHTIIARAVKK